MRPLSLPDLLWLPEKIDRCILSGKPVSWRKTKLKLVADEPVTMHLPVGNVSGESRPRYGFVEDLVMVLMERDLLDSNPTGITERGRPLSSAVMVGEDFVPLADFLEDIRETIEADVPDATEVKSWPQLDEEWEVAWRAAMWVDSPDGPQPASMVIIVAESLLMRASTLIEGFDPHADDVYSLLLRAAAGSMTNSVKGRPRRLVVPDSKLAAALRPTARELEVEIVHGECSLAKSAIDFAIQNMKEQIAPVLLANESAENARRFRDAADQFFRISPWKMISGDEYIAVRVEDEPWRYLNVMGQAGVEAGLSIFDDVLHLSRFLNILDLGSDEDDYQARIGDVGGSEMLGEVDPTTLSPEDVRLLQGENVISSRPVRIPIRFGRDGWGAPEYPLSFYVIAINGLLTALGRRRTLVMELDYSGTVEGRSVEIRYPARGDEGVSEEAPGVRLVFEMGDQASLFDPSSISVDAPPRAPLSEIAAVIADAHGIQIDGFEDDLSVFWMPDATGIMEVRAWHLLGLKRVRAFLGAKSRPVTVMPIAGRSVTTVEKI